MRYTYGKIIASVSNNALNQNQTTVNIYTYITYIYLFQMMKITILKNFIWEVYLISKTQTVLYKLYSSL